MAKLKNIFVSGINTIFGIFEEAVKEGTYNITVDDGFENPTTETDEIRCIFEKFLEKDIARLSFSELIQPNDVIGLIPAEDITLNMNTQQGYCIFSDETYKVEGFDLDPMSVIYTVLLRKV